MAKFLYGLVTLVILGGGLLAMRVPASGGETASCDQACNNACCDCCPQCGCRLVPVCRISCTTKKVTEYKYSCKCEEICIPPITPICKRGAACDCCDDDCSAGCGGRCIVREVKKLVKHPVTKEVPVRTCAVEWVCPKCSAGDDDRATSAPITAPAAPIAPVPATGAPCASAPN